jgi:elongation factor P
MSSIQATRLKKGMLIKMGAELLRIMELHHLTPGNKRGHVLCKLRDIRSDRLVDHKFRSEDDVERAILDEHEMQFLYREGDLFHFMNTETYEQIHLSTDVLGDNALYLLPESLINVEFYETEPVGIHLAPTVDLKVTDTSPGIKGATASAQVKPATLETGLVVNVPAFVNTGDVIRINTETGEYLSRAQ